MLIDWSYLKQFRKVYAGFSGGADSTALLLLIVKAAESANFAVEAVHFEHGLRGKESIEDAVWCEHFCEARNIPFRRIDLGMGGDTVNLESEARALRLEKWKDIVDPENEAVALGQHADDRIENLFLRLMRGSNSTGLTSLRSSQKIGDITFLRPLINLRRSEIESFLQKSGVTDWRTDRTNIENRFRRNFIRNKLMPMLNTEFTNSDKALLKSISALENDAAYLERGAEEAYRNIADKSAILAKDFEDMHFALRPRVLRLWLSDVCDYDVVPTADFIARFNDTIANFAEKPLMIPLNGTVSLRIEGGRISVCQAGKESHECVEKVWHWKTQPEIRWCGVVLRAKEIEEALPEKVNDRGCECVFFDADIVPDKLIVRNRREGDRMIPFAQNSSVRVKKLLQNADLTTTEKQKIPLVTTVDGTVVWIPGVRRANFANINESPNYVLQLYRKR